MSILKSLSEDHPQFYNDFIENGYALMSKQKAVLPRYYPHDYPVMRPIQIDDVEVNDNLLVRAFFKVGEGKKESIESGVISVRVDSIDGENVTAEIETKLPGEFPIQKGDTLNLTVDEIIDFDMEE